MTHQPAAQPKHQDLDHITDWVFDLDNTLYPHHSDLFSQIDVKMTSYVSKLLGKPREEARIIQKDLYLKYGTTLAGLMATHGIQADDFLEQVHDIDYSWLEPNPKLNDALGKLPGRKLILTNGSRKHAENTANQLGILHHFEDIFDIVSADLVPKPAHPTFEKFLRDHNVKGDEAIMFEDLSRNLVAPKALGMRTVLIMPHNVEPSFTEPWETMDGSNAHVDYATTDIAAFLHHFLDAQSA